MLIAEPWDIGPGGYQVGQFPANWLEWNDQYRDDVRKFWKGEASASDLAGRLSGSSDLFGEQTRTVNFLAAHDGFTVADTLAYEERHNEANGEDNRDGHGDNHSWNHGVEGPTDDEGILAARAASARALLGTLFASTGTIMLTAGDEFGRSQQGNNNAYCQSMPIDWEGRDMELEDFVAQRSAWRRASTRDFARFDHDSEWFTLGGAPMTPEAWADPETDGFELRIPGVEHPVRVDRAARFAG